MNHTKKLIVMLDEDSSIPDAVIQQVGEEKIYFVSTKTIDKNREYEYIADSIDGFHLTNKEMMVVNFSGDEELAQKLGDERTELIVYLPPETNNKYYMEEYLNTLASFINIFYKETV